MFTIVVAHDTNKGIGKNNSIPWNEPEDMKFFKELTINHIVIMGRRTFESIGRPLTGRINCVISESLYNNHPAPRIVYQTANVKTTDVKYTETSVKYFANPWDCVNWCEEYNNTKNNPTRKMFVIGGRTIYEWFLTNKLVSDEYVTYINGKFDCDVFYPKVKAYKTERVIKVFNSANVSDIKHKIVHKSVQNRDEMNMLELMNDIISLGNNKDDRTNTGTYSIFGQQLKFDISSSVFPLMTTRKMFLRGIFEELMLYLRGQTDSKILESKGINVWKGNTSREFLDNLGLTEYPVGDMGHSYGFSMKHFGATYSDCKQDYTGCGFNQLQFVIDEIKRNPNSRRLIISLWEPNHMHKAALPPCLYNYQFYVYDGYLYCMMTQRSSDFVLAGGWNVATGALLTYLIAHYTSLKPKELIWNLGDVHIYKNGINAAKEQVNRIPNIYPKLFLTNMPEKIEDVNWENIKLINYKPQKPISIPMNA